MSRSRAMLIARLMLVNVLPSPGSALAIMISRGLRTVVGAATRLRDQRPLDVAVLVGEWRSRLDSGR